MNKSKSKFRKDIPIQEVYEHSLTIGMDENESIDFIGMISHYIKRDYHIKWVFDQYDIPESWLEEDES